MPQFALLRQGSCRGLSARIAGKSLANRRLASEPPDHVRGKFVKNSEINIADVKLHITKREGVQAQDPDRPPCPRGPPPTPPPAATRGVSLPDKPRLCGSHDGDVTAENINGLVRYARSMLVEN